MLGVIKPIEMKCEEVLLDLDSFRSIGNLTTGSDGLSNSPIHHVLKFEDFDRLYRIIQKHTMIKLDAIHKIETESRLQILKKEKGISREYRKSCLRML